MDKKILFISDASQEGSGYMNISTNLAVGLSKKGYDLKWIGLGYRGQQHYYPFSILPCGSFAEVNAEYHNMNAIWQPDLTICALDIPMQERMMRQVMSEKRIVPFLSIFPVEGDPLCMEWALNLSNMQGHMCISQFGTEECHNAGINADYIQIGIDTQSWRFPLPEEKSALRKKFGFEEDDLIILTVADNQERKNLSAALRIVTDLEKKLDKPIKYIMVTREFQPTGWRLRTLAQEFGYSGLTIFERGLSFKDLLSVYFMADIFLITSKAEGLCMPVLEAQATGLPVFGTDCTALHELLCDGKGVLLPVAYTHRDVYGNSRRYFVNEEVAVKKLALYLENEVRLEDFRDNGRKAVEARTWEITIEQLDKKIKEMLPEAEIEQAS